MAPTIENSKTMSARSTLSKVGHIILRLAMSLASPHKTSFREVFWARQASAIPSHLGWSIKCEHGMMTNPSEVSTPSSLSEPKSSNLVGA